MTNTRFDYKQLEILKKKTQEAFAKVVDDALTLDEAYKQLIGPIDKNTTKSVLNELINSSPEYRDNTILVLFANDDFTAGTKIGDIFKIYFRSALHAKLIKNKFLDKLWTAHLKGQTHDKFLQKIFSPAILQMKTESLRQHFSQPKNLKEYGSIQAALIQLYLFDGIFKSFEHFFKHIFHAFLKLPTKLLTNYSVTDERLKFSTINDVLQAEFEKRFPPGVDALRLPTPRSEAESDVARNGTPVHQAFSKHLSSVTALTSLPQLYVRGHQRRLSLGRFFDKTLSNMINISVEQHLMVDIQNGMTSTEAFKKHFAAPFEREMTQSFVRMLYDFQNIHKVPVNFNNFINNFLRLFLVDTCTKTLGEYFDTVFDRLKRNKSKELTEYHQRIVNEWVYQRAKDRLNPKEIYPTCLNQFCREITKQQAKNILQRTNSNLTDYQRSFLELFLAMKITDGNFGDFFDRYINEISREQIRERLIKFHEENFNKGLEDLIRAGHNLKSAFAVSVEKCAQLNDKSTIEEVTKVRNSSLEFRKSLSDFQYAFLGLFSRNERFKKLGIYFENGYKRIYAKNIEILKVHFAQTTLEYVKREMELASENSENAYLNLLGSKGYAGTLNKLSVTHCIENSVLSCEVTIIFTAFLQNKQSTTLGDFFDHCCNSLKPAAQPDVIERAQALTFGM